MSTETMKALRKARTGRGAEIERVAVPAVGPNDVLVRVRAASICGTDVHIYGWNKWSQGRIKPPLTFGHEFCGTVERVGESVAGVKPGDFVSAEMHVACGHCYQCRVGQAHICQNVKVLGIDADGCFAEFVKIPATNIWKIDAAIPEHYAAIMDPLGNAVHTVLAGAIAGRTVAIVGCGPIGLMATAVAKACGASTIFATEINPHRLSMASKMGADEALNPKEVDVVKRVKEATGGTGVDVMLEMSGNPKGIHEGFQMLRAGGRASLLGVPSQPVTFDLVADIIFKGVTVQGIYGRKMFGTWEQMTSLLKAGRLNLEPLFKERMALDDYKGAFELLEGGQASKVLFYPNGTAR